jgi:hypothetical protein
VINARLFLALAQARLGQREQASRALSAAVEALESSASSHGDYGGMSWDRRLIAQRLAQEAEKLLMQADDASQERSAPKSELFYATGKSFPFFGENRRRLSH